MGSVVHLSGPEVSTTNNPKYPLGLKVRNKQALSMLRAGKGLGHVIDGLRAGVPMDIALEDLEEIQAYLYRHSFG